MAQSVTTTGLSRNAFDALKKTLTELVDPLSDSQLLDLADGIHEMLRQRRTLRHHHAQRMLDRSRTSAPI